MIWTEVELVTLQLKDPTPKSLPSADSTAKIRSSKVMSPVPSQPPSGVLNSGVCAPLRLQPSLYRNPFPCWKQLHVLAERMLPSIHPGVTFVSLPR